MPPRRTPRKSHLFGHHRKTPRSQKERKLPDLNVRQGQTRCWGLFGKIHRGNQINGNHHHELSERKPHVRQQISSIARPQPLRPLLPQGDVQQKGREEIFRQETHHLWLKRFRIDKESYKGSSEFYLLLGGKIANESIQNSLCWGRLHNICKKEILPTLRKGVEGT